MNLKLVTAIVSVAFSLTLAGGWALADQIVFLDFTGGTTAPGGSTKGTKGAFAASPSVTKFVDANDPAKDTADEVATTMMNNILAKMQADYKGFWVGLTKTKPASGDFSTVDFGSGTMTDDGDLGTVDTGPGSQIDPGNKNKKDDSWIFVDAHTAGATGGGFNQGQVENELANSGSHELGHLLGLYHDDGSATTIMDAAFNGTDKGFSDKSKGKLAASVGFDINGKHVTIQELLKRISGWITRTIALSIDYSPVGGNQGLGEFVLNGGLGTGMNPGTTLLEGGTVLVPGQGFHSEALEIEDPLGQFVVEVPERLSVAGNGPGGPIVEPFNVTVFPDSIAAQPIMQLNVFDPHFDPLATVVNFEGTAGSDSDVDNTVPEATPGATTVIDGIIGNAEVFINPAFLGLGSYLDGLVGLLGVGRSEFVLSTNIREATLDFAVAGTAGENRAAWRLVPEPSTVLLLMLSLGIAALGRSRR